MITESTSLRELAFIVCTALHEAGVTAVLSGGGAATIYAPDVYQSRDLDFIFQFWAATVPPDRGPLERLGFTQRGGTFHHPATQFTVEFPNGPLAVGDELIRSWDTLEEDNQTLHILTPTDCVRDRLAWFFQRATDFASLEQALGVAERHLVDLNLIRDWSIREGAQDKYEIFAHRLGL